MPKYMGKEEFNKVYDLARKHRNTDIPDLTDLAHAIGPTLFSSLFFETYVSREFLASTLANMDLSAEDLEDQIADRLLDHPIRKTLTDLNPLDDFFIAHCLIELSHYYRNEESVKGTKSTNIGFSNGTARQFPEELRNRLVPSYLENRDSLILRLNDPKVLLSDRDLAVILNVLHEKQPLETLDNADLEPKLIRACLELVGYEDSRVPVMKLLGIDRKLINTFRTKEKCDNLVQLCRDYLDRTID